MKNSLLIKRILAAIMIAVFLFTGCEPKETIPVIGKENEHTETPPGEEIDEPGEEPNNHEEDEPGNEETPLPEQGQETQVKPVSNKDTRSVQYSDYWEAMDNIASAAAGYYSEYFTKTRIITENGLLYNKAAEQLIDVNYLCDYEGLNNKYRNYPCEILLLKPEDVSSITGLSFTYSGDEFMVFVSVRLSGINSYLITSSKKQGGVISNYAYGSIISAYSQSHGAVRRLYGGASEYERIINYICMYESKFEDYYVREITTDDKYAMAVLSPVGNTADVRQYILRKSGSNWEVVMSRLEKESRVVVAVNKRLPDFNPVLLPEYTLYDYRNTLLTDFSGVLNTLIGLGIIKTSADVRYIAGADKYCYIVLNSAVKYIAEREEGQWRITHVADYDRAYEYLISSGEKMPTFILWDR